MRYINQLPASQVFTDHLGRVHEVDPRNDLQFHRAKIFFRGWLFSAKLKAISPFTVHIGFKSDLDLPGFLAQADLQPVSIEKVNFPKIWSLVICRKA